MHRILIADDGKPIRRVMELALSREDVELQFAADGDAALNLVDDGFAPDIALLDVHMPRKGGLELCRDLRERNSSIKVLLLVGTFEPFDEQEGREAGAEGHLLKPFAAEELLQVVTAMLQTDDPESDTHSDGPADLESSLPEDDDELGDEFVDLPDAPTEDADSNATLTIVPEEREESTPGIPSILTGAVEGLAPSVEDEKGIGEPVDIDTLSDEQAADEVDQIATVMAPRDEVADVRTHPEPTPEIGPERDDRSEVEDVVNHTAETKAAKGQRLALLSEQELDELAWRVAEHLRTSLFGDRADELFIRAAKEQIDARIERLEREIAADGLADEVDEIQSESDEEG